MAPRSWWPVGLVTWWFGRWPGALALLLALALYSLSAAIQPVDEFLFTLVARVVAFTLVVVLVS